MTRQQKTNQLESIATLHKLLNPGDTVTCILRHVSRSGMQRRISFAIAQGGEIRDITFDVARALGESIHSRSGYVQDVGMVVNGCGMDMGFHIVYSLGRTLFPDGFGEAPRGQMVNGELRTATDALYRPENKEQAELYVHIGYVFRGRNGDTSGWDNDGGYALKHRWI